eukprot:7040731-Prymnesium_polylepis.1
MQRGRGDGRRRSLGDAAAGGGSVVARLLRSSRRRLRRHGRLFILGGRGGPRCGRVVGLLLRAEKPNVGVVQLVGVFGRDGQRRELRGVPHERGALSNGERRLGLLAQGGAARRGARTLLGTGAATGSAARATGTIVEGCAEATVAGSASSMRLGSRWPAVACGETLRTRAGRADQRPSEEPHGEGGRHDG